MRLDAHVHFWRYTPDAYGWIDDTMTPLRRDFLPVDLAPELERAGFDGCVAVQARQDPEETAWLLELARRHAFIKGVVGWADLRSPGVGVELETLARHRALVGLRHVVQSEPDDFLLQPDFQRGVALLEDFGLAYDILIYPRQLAAAVTFARRFPRQRFVLDHAAKPQVKAGEIDVWRRDLAALAACPNVMCKLSGLVTEADWSAWTEAQLRPYLDAVFECFGPKRLMIGSDWPVCTLAGTYGRVMALVTDYLQGRPAAERADVMGLNAAAFWKLERQEQA